MQFGPLDHDCQTYTSAVTLRVTLPYNARIAMGTRKQREKQENFVVGHTELASALGHPFYQRLSSCPASTGRCSGEPPCTCSWHAAHRVIRFCSTSPPDWLRSLRWCTCRCCIL